MDAKLLRFMNQQVRIKNDPHKQEYTVAGINWATNELFLLGDGHALWQHNGNIELLDNEEADNDPDRIA